MKVLLSGEEQKTMVIPQPVRYIPKATVLKVKPIEPKETTEDKIKKLVTWGSLGLLVYKILS